MTGAITAAASSIERPASALVVQVEAILHKQLDSGSLRARHAAITALHDLAPRLGPALQRSLPRLVGRLLDCICEPSREVGPSCVRVWAVDLDAHLQYCTHEVSQEVRGTEHMSRLRLLW